jgi:hypothetical protein
MSAETLVPTRSLRRHISDNEILHCHRRRNLKSYTKDLGFMVLMGRYCSQNQLRSLYCRGGGGSRELSPFSEGYCGVSISGKGNICLYPTAPKPCLCFIHSPM